MADQIFNIAKGAFVEKFRDGASNGLVMLLEAAEADATLSDYDDVAALLSPAGNTESTATGYGRKTGITGTITVDDSNDRTDVDIPDQTWTGLDGNQLAKLIVGYDEGGTDATRVPLSHHDFTANPDGSDLVAEFNAAGFGRAQN